MSVKVMGRVWDSDLAPNHRLMLLAYADAAEHDGTQSYPGEQRLVEMTGYSVSTVRRITAELLALGVLVRVKTGHRGQRAEYALDFDVLEEASHPGRQPVEGPDGESLSSDARKPTASDTPPVLDPSLREDLLPTVVDPVAAAPRKRDEIWDTLLEFPDAFPPPTNDATRGKRNRVVKLLRQSGATPEQIRLRVQAWPFHYGDATLTDTALANHWDVLGQSPARASRSDVDLFEDTARRQARARDAADLDAQRRGLPA